MNFAHLHLIINHFPIASALFGFCILAIGKLRNNESYCRVALSLLVVGGIAAIAAYFTGNSAAEVISTLPTFAVNYVHEHRLAAKFGLWSMIITGALASGGLFLSFKRGSIPKGYVIFLFIVNFWALTVIARVNYLGGQISHPETRTNPS